MSEVQAELAKWRKLPAKSPKVEPARQKILSSLSELQVDLQDMQATIDIALKDPAKFQLTPSELMTRQDFVRDLVAQANDAQEELQFSQRNTPARNGVSRGDRKALLASGGSSSCYDLEGGSSSSAGGGNGGGGSCSSSAAAWQENESEVGAAKMQQEQILERQEVELTVLDKSVARMGEMGKVIGDELRQQSKALDEFTGEVDEVSGKMTHATNVMKKMLKKNDRGKLCTILVLTLVLIGLFYAVFAW